MCGFVGVYDKAGAEQYDVKSLLNIIHHRGPDEQRVSVLQNAAIGFARLAIIDLKGGSQPMKNEDKSVTIAMNGEIYNYIELRNELINKGVVFKTNSDTEVLLQMYMTYGIDMLVKLKGMFGVVIADTRTDELFLIRDRVGIKPLYYTNDCDGRIGFSSEVKPLLRLPFVTKDIKKDSVAEFLQYEYVQAPNTLFKDVNKVKPGHYLVISKGEISEHKYWDCNDTNINLEMTIDSAKNSVIKALRESLSMHLRSDVQLGFFLSGGIDSGLLVALASEQIKNIDTYTLNFENGDFNESDLAQKVAERYGTNHHCYTVKSDDFEKLLPQMLWFFDEPIADSGILPNYMLNELVHKDGTKVIISGAGGDELFAGYNYYFESKMEKKINNHPLLSRAAEVIFKHINPDISQKISRSLLYKKNPLEHMLCCEQIFSDKDIGKLIGILPKGAAVKRKYGNSCMQNGLNVLLYTDFKTYLSDDLMLLSDRTCMAHSIEGRVPYLDHSLIELAFSIPKELKAPNDNRKWLLKEIAKDYLPNEIFEAPKMGFCSPIQTWANNGFSKFAYRILTSERAIKRNVWKQEEFSKYVLNKKNYEKNFNRIYILLILELFFRVHIDNQYDSKDDICMEEIYG